MKILLLIFLFSISVFAQSPTANAGADKTVFVNQIVVLDGSASTNAFDGWRPKTVSKDHAIKWDFGYGGFQHQGSLIAPIAYPETGTFTATLTVCNSSDSCVTDTTQVTVNPIPDCASEVVMTDTGNSVTNMSNLQTEINSSVSSNNRCITLPNGWVGRSGTSLPGIVLPHRTVNNFLTIRPANYANLSFGRRVALSDISNMAIMETGTSGGNNTALPIIDTLQTTSTSPSNFYNIVGIYFRKAVESAAYTGIAMLNIGRNDETALNQLPNNIIVDRCVMDGSTSTTNSWRGVLFDGSDLALVNSYIYGFKGVALETQAVLQSQGERNNYMNNFMEGATENFMSGGLNIAIQDHLPRYISFRRNDLKKNLAWCAVCGSYGGIDYSVKNIFELKVAAVWGIEGNIFENHWIEDQNWAITTTVRNSGVFEKNYTADASTNVFTTSSAHNLTDTQQVFVKNIGGAPPTGLSLGFTVYFVRDATSTTFKLATTSGGSAIDITSNGTGTNIVATMGNPWADINYVDFSYNIVKNVANGIQFLGNDYLNPSTTVDHVSYRQSVFTGISKWSGFHNLIVVTSGLNNNAGADRLSVRNISTDNNGSGGQGRFIDFDSNTNFTNCNFSGNIVQGFISFSGEATTGDAAMQAACSTNSYEVVRNGFYKTTGTNPTDNSSVSLRSDVKYTDITNNDLSLQNDSPFLTTGFVGGRSGADVSAVNSMTSGTVSGVWTSSGVKRCNWNTNPPCNQ